MNYVGKVFSSVRGYMGINPATLTGAIDVIVIRQDDGSYVTSPWHVRFGKMGVIRAKQKVVDIEINGEPVDLHMKLGEAGEAFFVEEAKDAAEVPVHLATSPLQMNSIDLMEKGLMEMKESFSSADQMSDLLTPVVEQGGGMVVTMEGNSPVVSVLPKASLAQSLPETGHFASAMDDFHRQQQLQQQPRLLLKYEASTQTDLSGNDVNLQKSQYFDDDGMVVRDMQLRNAVSAIELGGRTSCMTVDLGVAVQTESTVLEDPTPKKVFTLDPDTISTAEFHSDVVQAGRHREKTSEQQTVTLNSDRNESDDCLFEMELDDLDGETEAPLVGQGHGLQLERRRRFSGAKVDSRNQFVSIYQSFSDTDLTPVASPSSSRPSSPKSDTELDNVRNDATSQTHLTSDRLLQTDDVMWKWGEFPETPSSKKSVAKEETVGKTEDTKTDKKTQSASKLPSGGMYLEDLKQDDPELIRLYLYDYRSPPKAVEEDRESGRGVSLPQSPVTVQMETLDIGTDGLSGAQKIAQWDLAMSLCGATEEHEPEAVATKFQQHLISFEALCSNPNVFSDPNLIIRISGKYYKWQVAGPLIMSVLLFNRPLKDSALETLMKQHMPKKEQRKRGWLWWGGKDSVAPLNTSPDKLETTVTKDTASSAPSSQAPSPPGTPGKIKDRSKSLVKDNSSIAMDAAVITSANEISELLEGIKEDPVGVRDVYKKSLKLSSEQIAKLNLNEGANEVTFSVTTQYQGTTRCTCFVFLWNWNDKIVVSDIDGTITKSDVLGQVLPMIGQVLPYINNDWSQVGIARLYSMIADNGYKFLYLSARAIGQSKITRDYLRSIRQGEVSLPDGPLLLSPSSLVSAFHKEVIERKPEEFKISCLKDIKELFPTSINPLLAGFGNRINDVWAYTTIGIPRSRIFTVNPKGQLRIETLQAFESSYTRLSDIVDHVFPPLDLIQQIQNMPCNNEFNTFTYWRDPLPDVDDCLTAFVKQAAVEAATKKNEKKPDKKAKPQKKS